MTAHWPQFLIIGALAFNFAAHCSLSGQPRPDFDPTMYLIFAAIEVFVLFQGGFFAPLGWAP